MKRFFLTFILFSCILFSLFSHSPLLERESSYYKISSSLSSKEAQFFGKKMDALFRYFNDYFHFDVTSFSSKLIVKIFSDEADYFQYIRAYSQSNSPFVFLQFEDASQNQLVGCSCRLTEFQAALPHYAFIQFLRSFIESPPLWLEKGFAAFFERAKYRQKQDKIFHRENLIWLNPLRTLIAEGKELISIDLLLELDEKEIRENRQSFYALSWGVVFFLLHSTDPLYNRIIWDSIRSLQPNATQKVNNRNCQKIFEWINFNRFYKELCDYINSLNTFDELLKEGILCYEHKEMSKAKEIFDKAIILESENFISYYYLGLIHFNQKDYSMAEFYYISALQLNGEAAFCYYALGLNALMQKHFHKGEKYLLLAVQHNHRLREKAEAVLAHFKNS